jgi:HK97 family phage prohead protease
METITGYASVFYREGDTSTEFKLWEGAVERIDRNAFDNALSRKDDAAGLYNHNPDHLLGRVSNGTVRLKTDDRGLHYEIDAPDTTLGKDVATLLERGDLKGSSFAFVIDGERWERDGDNEIRTITDLTLYDVGPVTNPAYAGSTSGVRCLRFVDNDGGTIACRSADVSEARSSHEAWQKRLQETQAETRQAQATRDAQVRLAQMDR